MKAYTELAEEVGGKEERRGAYVSKLKSHSGKKISPGGNRHFGIDYTGKGHLGEN